MPRVGDDRYKDTGQPLPYRAETDVDRVLGKRRKINTNDPNKLESYPLAKLYHWKIASRES